MEVIRASAHLSFPMDHASRVGEARRHAAELAEQVDLPEAAAGRLALVLTELGTNLLRHARGGELLLSAQAGRRQVELIAIDRGPGIGDLPRSLGDGFSTGGTPGTGLGAVSRQADDFDIHSEVPGGTIVLARIRPRGDGGRPLKPQPAALRCAAISVPIAGERVCGDGWAVVLDGTRAVVLVADGLGHGPDAAEASEAAVAALVADPWLAPAQQLQRLHVALRGTRGAALSIYHLDAESGQVRSAGAGNVLARLVSGTADRTLLVQHGTAGVQIRTPEEHGTAWPQHALLVAHSDGIASRWPPAALAPVLRHDPAIAAALLLREHSRGRDDATVLVLGRSA